MQIHILSLVLHVQYFFKKIWPENWLSPTETFKYHGWELSPEDDDEEQEDLQAEAEAQAEEEEEGDEEEEEEEEEVSSSSRLYRLF